MPRNLGALALVSNTIKATCFTNKFLQKKYEEIPAADHDGNSSTQKSDFSLICTHYDENNLRGSNSATIITTTSTRFITVGLEKAVWANSLYVLALLSLKNSLD